MKITEFDGNSGTIEQTPATRQLVMAEIVKAAPILNFVEFYKYLGSRKDTIAKIAGKVTSGVGSRVIGDDYAEAATLAPSFEDMNLKIVGGLVNMDKAYERSNAGGTGSEYLRLMVEYAGAVGRHFTDMVINGDSSVDAKSFDGAIKLAKSNNKLVFDTENGGSLPLGNGATERKQQQKFVEYMNTVIEYADVVVMGQKLKSRLKAIAWDKFDRVTFEDVFGRKFTFDYYEDKPILTAGKKKDNVTDVIGIAETCGTSTDCTSLHGLKFGEKANFAFGTNVGFQVGTPSTTKNLIESRIEADIGSVLLFDDAIRSLSGIRLNA